MEMEAPFDGLLARCNFHLQGLDNFFYTLINPERRNVCTEKFGGDLVLFPLHRPLSLSLSPPLSLPLSLSLDCRLRIFYLFTLCYFQTVNLKKV